MPIGDGLPEQLQIAIQQGALKAAFERKLKGKRAYTMAATGEDVKCHRGNTLTLTREGGFARKTQAVNQTAKNADLNNGLTADQASLEQYTLTMDEWMATAALNIMDDEVLIVSNAKKIVENQGDQAADTIECMVRDEYFNTYMGGNTKITSSITATTGTCGIDDIRGFGDLLVNGKIASVSGTNLLAANETATGGSGQTQALNITGVTPDATNISSALAVGGISGVITYQTLAHAPVAGDVLIAANAPEMLRPNGKEATHLLVSTDVFSTDIAFDMSVILENNGTPRMPDGTYWCFVSPKSHRQLFATDAFEKAYRGQYNTDPYRKGVITEFEGIKYIKTNFAIRQQLVNTDGNTIFVERPLMVGAESMIRGDYEGLENFVKKKENSKVHDVKLIDGIIYIIRDAIDLAGQNVGLTWDTIIDFACPSDMTTTSALIPTASNKMFKRAVVCEHCA